MVTLRSTKRFRYGNTAEPHARQAYLTKYGCAQWTPDAISTLANHTPLIEIGAGASLRLLLAAMWVALLCVRVLKRGVSNTLVQQSTQMGVTLLYAGSKTCFGASTKGAGTKTHLESRCCAILIYVLIEWQKTAATSHTRMRP